MNNTYITKITLLVTLFLCNIMNVNCRNISNKVIFVSNNGVDTNEGFINTPLKTIEKAIEKSYSFENDIANLDSIVIYLRKGTYRLTAPLILTNDKLNKTKIIISSYLNENVIISGGYEINSWKEHDKEKSIYKTSLNTNSYFRQLYYGSKEKGTRAKEIIKEKFQLEKDIVISNNIEFSSWKNSNNIELVSNREWSQTRALVSSIERKGDYSYLYMQQPNYRHVRELHSMVYFDSPSWIENAYELINEPGEWYLDENMKILYLKDDSQKIIKQTVTIPRLEQLVILRGTQNNPIKNIEFHNIDFAHTTWNQPSQIGFAALQANQLEYPDNIKSNLPKTIPSAVEVVYGNEIIFKDCNFYQLGGAGLNISKSKDCKVNNCSFYNIAGSGIQILGYVDEPFPKEQDICEKIEIRNNLIQNIANEYYGGIGIFVGFARNINISNNELDNLPYTAISIGWGWGIPSICEKNTIQNNYIHDYLTQLKDGAGIYTLGNQPNSFCRNNYICNMVKQEWGGGMYFDEGTGGFTVENNVIENVINWVFCHKAKNISINNNYSKVRDVLFIKSKDCIMNNTHNIYTNEWPNKAMDIINKAGKKK